MIFRLSILIIGLVISSNTPAKDSQELIQLGHERCIEAFMMSNVNIPKAEILFAEYLELKKQAIAQNPSTETNPSAATTRVFNYCEQTKDHIEKNKPTYYFRRAYKACTSATKYIDQRQIKNASQALESYAKNKAQAYKTNSSSLQTQSIKDKIVSCEAKSANFPKVKEEAGVVNALEKYIDQCQNPRTFSGSNTEKRQLIQQNSFQITQYLQEIKETAIRRESPYYDLILNLSSVLSNCRAKLDTSIDELSKKIDLEESYQSLTQKSQKNSENKQIESAGLQKSIQEDITRSSNVSGSIDKAVNDTIKPELNKKNEPIPVINTASLVNPVPINNIKPKYPDKARSPMVGSPIGHTVVEYQIDTEGNVINAEVIESFPKRIFNKASLSAIKKWNFPVENIDTSAVFQQRFEFNPYD